MPQPTNLPVPIPKPAQDRTKAFLNRAGIPAAEVAKLKLATRREKRISLCRLLGVDETEYRAATGLGFADD